MENVDVVISQQLRSCSALSVPVEHRYITWPQPRLHARAVCDPIEGVRSLTLIPIFNTIARVYSFYLGCLYISKTCLLLYVDHVLPKWIKSGKKRELDCNLSLHRCNNEVPPIAQAYESLPDESHPLAIVLAPALGFLWANQPLYTVFTFRKVVILSKIPTETSWNKFGLIRCDMTCIVQYRITLQLLK